MLDTNIALIRLLKDFILTISTDDSLLSLFRFSSNDFVRSRKLPFKNLVLLITKLCKKTLSVELETFFNELNQSTPCSVSAFVQQRLKLKPVLFEFWNHFLCEAWYLLNNQVVKKWKGYRVVAVDGSNITLVSSAVLSKHFGGQDNQNGTYTLAKTFYYYDVLNELVINSKITPYRCAELNIAYDMVDKTEEDMLLIYDRNFGNYKLIALHLWQEKERKFIIRAKDSLQMIKNFVQSGKTTAIIQWPPTTYMIAALRKKGYCIDKNTTLKVRLVRVELEGSVEVLITNLWEEEGYPDAEFKGLYFMRWGVETNIFIQKNIMQLESFSGLSVTAVEQDFYATIMMTNLHSILIKHAQQSIDNSKTKRKYPMKINKNKSFGRLKFNFVKLFLTEEPKAILEKLHDHFEKEIIPIRKGRQYERKRKNPHTKSKFKTFTNFKPAY